MFFLLSSQFLVAQQAITYDEAIIYGDRKFNESSFKDAKAYYQMALRFKPNDVYAKDKIDLIIKKLQERMAGEEAYYELVDKADELYNTGKLNQAIVQYQQSLEVIPGDEYATSQITKIIEFQTKEKEKLEHYETLMASGKASVASKKYDEAIQQYDEAGKLFPENSEPGELTTVAKSLQVEWLDQQMRCAAKIEEASRYILIQNYATALDLYQEALDKIKEIEPLAEKQKKYNTLVGKADESYINKDFIAARTQYQSALAMWPEKTYAGDMLKQIDDQLADQRKDLDKNYTNFIVRGDSLFNAAAYTEAKGEFNLALNLKPEEAYPKQKLAAIEQHFATLQQSFEANYGKVIAGADSAFEAGKYAIAKTQYETALTVKPDEVYPQQRIGQINQKLDELEQLTRVNNAYLTLVADADQLASAGQLELALSKYLEAGALKPTESYPSKRIEEINLLLVDARKQKETDDKYQEQVVLAEQLFNEDKLAESKNTWQQALVIKPYEVMPKLRIAAIDSLVVVRGRQAEIDRQYRSLLVSGDSLQIQKLYAEALVVFEKAANVKPGDPQASQRIQEVKDIRDKLEKEAARKLAYEESIAKANALFGKENYELAKSEFQHALTFGPNEAYPKEKIAEIDQLLVKLAAEREQRYNQAVETGNAFFDQEQYKQALDEYQIAASIRPEDAFVTAKITECNNKLAEVLLLLTKEYKQAVAEADNLYTARIYDKAITAYRQAQSIKSDETYPGEMIAKITKYIEENAITDVLNGSLAVQTKTTEKLAFEPVPVNVRKSNYVFVRARNLSGHPVSVIFSYGSNAGKNGGFVLQMPEDDQVNDFIIRVGNQYKWFSEDNNWLEIYPENGDIEITLVRISTTN
ncbi:MAG: hypothetical protein KKB74_12180 [Bacteroidetes bacterium]|nr:hypothetical protein [Bacteroidota bacterium]